MENTRAAIIEQSLTLFSERGYEGVSMRDIARAVGIKAASLYNHFVSKEAIFNSIIDEMALRYQERAEKALVPQGEMTLVVRDFMRVDDAMLTDMARELFLYFLRDDFAARFRRLLTMEQYRSARAGDAYRRFFIDSALDFQKSLFENMMALGAFIPCDPAVMAMHFYAPVFLLLNQYDHKMGHEDEALDMLAKLVRQFALVYSRKDGKKPV